MLGKKFRSVSSGDYFATGPFEIASFGWNVLWHKGVESTFDPQWRLKIKFNNQNAHG
jgi:hypothetical protein